MKQVTLLMILLAIACSASAQTSPLTLVDHFRCYPFPPQQARQVVVGLQDQFGPKLTNLTIGPLEFCNPVQKTVNGTITPILDPNHHFVMYSIALPQVLRQATISNQFGTQTLILTGASRSAVPAGLGQPPPPPSADLDHYECYFVQTQPPLNVVVTLQDAFITETVTVLQPAQFCNPMVKTHNGAITGIQNPSTHLTCYATSASGFSGGTVNTGDQFFPWNLPILAPDLLCLPSLKLSWKPIGE